MPKFFVDSNCINDGLIKITGENYSHICTVLRFEEGDTITVCDGMGTDYECVIKELNKKNIFAEIIKGRQNKGEPKTNIILFQSIPKADKMELIIMKSVELGVKKIVPVITSRSIGNYSGKEEKKLERFRKISEAAAKQSGRGIIPEVSMPMSLLKSLDIAQSLDLALVAYENERETTIKQELKRFTGKSIGVYIGPEGGFSDEEIDVITNRGIHAVTLGSRILRTETAGPTVTAIILYEMEGINS